MYVTITLFKSGLSPANIFVGDSAVQRQSALLQLPHNTLARSPFNPQDPFRLNGNAFTFKRKWDYAEYIFYDSEDANAAELMRKYYFITEFEYVNDTVTRIICTEDVLSAVFWSLTQTQIFPESATFKLSEEAGKPLKGANEGGNYVYLPDSYIYQLPPKVAFLGSETYRVGAIILTISGKIPIQNGGFIDPGYIEDGVQQPLTTLLIPFVLNPRTGQINRKDNSSEILFYSYQNGAKQRLNSVTQLSSLSTISEGDMQIESATISFDLPNLVWNIEEIANDSQGLAISSLQLNTGATISIRDGGYYTLQLKSFYNTHDFLTIDLSFVFSQIEELYAMREPYYQIAIIWGSNKQTINPLDFYSYNYGLLPTAYRKMYIKYSWLPPYNITISFEVDLNGGYTRELSMQIQTYSPYTTWKDGFTEWLRANYNSQIVGLKVRQNERQNAAEIGYFSGLMNQAQRAGVAWVSGSPAASAGSALGLLTYGADVLASEAQLQNQVAAENELQGLLLQDKQNSVDTFNFGNNIVQTYYTTPYLRIFLTPNAELDAMLKTDRLYGVKKNSFTTLGRKHQNFDYYRASGIEYKAQGLSLSRSDRAYVIESLKKGVRVWYNIATLLNFDAQNPEVENG